MSGFSNCASSLTQYMVITHYVWLRPMLSMSGFTSIMSDPPGVSAGLLQITVLTLPPLGFLNVDDTGGGSM